MPASAAGVYVAGSIAVVGASVAFKKYVYDPHIKPFVEDVLATWLHHSQCLANSVEATVDYPEDQQMQGYQGHVSSPSTPWHRYHPSRKFDSNANSDHELEREMDFLGIPDVHQDQFASPGSVSPGLKGLKPFVESSENEARQGGNIGSALGIDLSGEAGEMLSRSSAMSTGVKTTFCAVRGSHGLQTGAVEGPDSLRRRHTERDHVADSGRWTSMDNSSQYTIVPVTIVHDKNSTPTETHGEPSRLTGAPEPELNTTPSSPDLTESSLIDITDDIPSAFTGSSASIHGYTASSSWLANSSLPSRAHSPAFSSSSYDVLSSPGGIASMPSSPHSMNASISLDVYPAFDEYNIHNRRYLARHPASRVSSYPPSDSGWTDGDLSSEG